MGYTFRVVQETEHTEDEERYGLIDYRTQTIQLNRNTSDERKQETLVHELIHLVLDFTKGELEEDDVPLPNLEGEWTSSWLNCLTNDKTPPRSDCSRPLRDYSQTARWWVPPILAG